VIDPRDVHPDHGQSFFRGLVKQTLAGKATLAVHRRRRVPRTTFRAVRADRGDRGVPLPPEDPHRSFRGVYVLSAGPGSWDDVAEVVESIEHFEGDQAKVVVVDDATTDVRRRVVRERFPAVTVLRRRVSSGGPPGMFPLFAESFDWIRRAFAFDVLVKLDADALLTGPAMAARAADAFAADPTLGMLGTVVRADGKVEDFTYDSWVLAHERRWSPQVRRLEAAARARGWDDTRAQAGVIVFGRKMLDRAAADGWWRWRPPWWTLLQDDAAYGMITAAVGLRVGSWGGPGEPIARGQWRIPIDKQQVLDQGALAVHTMRQGAHGESQDELRAFFRAARGARAAS